MPAPQRVPASSGPSVPTSSPALASPARIPFKISAPIEDESPNSEPWITKESVLTGERDTATTLTRAAQVAYKRDKGTDNLEISLALKPILQGLPPFQLTGDISEVPDDARVRLPFALVEPQLAFGRVTLKPEEFLAGLPEEFVDLFNPDNTAATISLPLQEVLKNLPGESLRMRDDQSEEEQVESFATPFAAKAQEDAKRFKVAGNPIARPLAHASGEPAAPPEAPPLAVLKEPEAKPAPSRSPLQTALNTDGEVDAKAVVAHVSKMAGVKACAIMFGDGLSLAGSLPEAYEADGLCAMAPALLQRIENHMVETKLGTLRAMTLSCSSAAVTFFMHDNLCLAALHVKEELASDVRERLASTVQELSKQYSTPA